MVSHSYSRLSDEVELARLGVKTQFSAARWRTSENDDKEIINEDHKLRKLMKIGTAFGRQEVLYCTMWMSTFRYVFISLLEDIADVKNLMQRLQRLHEAAMECDAHTLAFLEDDDEEEFSHLVSRSGDIWFVH